MFTSERVAARLAAISLKSTDVDDEAKQFVECRFELSPFSYDLASEIGGHVAEYLYIIVEPQNPTESRAYLPRVDVVDDVTFRTKDVEHEFELYRSHDDSVPCAVRVKRAIAHKLRVKRDKKAPLFEASFLLTFELPPAKELYSLVSLFSQVAYVTLFELPDESKKQDELF